MDIILNADDFGLSPDSVEETIRCFEQGLLTSATIMARMPATDAALAFASKNRQFSFGVHLTFVGEGPERAVSPAASVAALTDKEGCFLPARTVRARALVGRIPIEQIEQELAAQIDVVRAAGIAISHVDSHRHLHKLGPFREALRRVLPDYGIARVRNVQDVYLARLLRSPTFWLGPRWRRQLMNLFATTDHFYMPTTAHDEQWEDVTRLVELLPGNSLEIGVHPGREQSWRQREITSLLPFCERAAARGHQLVTWDSVRPSARGL